MTFLCGTKRAVLLGLACRRAQQKAKDSFGGTGQGEKGESIGDAIGVNGVGMRHQLGCELVAQAVEKQSIFLAVK